MTNKQFADAVGINPAAVSHLLAGRNNPSYDLVYKILEAFPALNPDWLIMGRDPMYRNGNAGPHVQPDPVSQSKEHQEPDLFSLSGLSADGGWTSAPVTPPAVSAPTESAVPDPAAQGHAAASAASSLPSETVAPAATPEAASASATAGAVTQTIIKEVVKTLPQRKIVRVVVYFDDNTYEDFQTAKPAQE
ncbi:MAG: helix-turn-helix transcriptional regulator [Paludibacteraceae bacterium]|nr:helix-turn-helix transcriptional regulator [Paludibacteraceae bacterium]